MVRSVVWTLLVTLLAALLLLLLLMLLEPAMIYHPAPPEGATPADWGLPYEDVTLESADGERLRAWWLPRPEPDAPALLFFHGNAGNREHRLHNVAGLWRAGLAVLIFDYRGYGGSTGRPNEAGLVRDGAAAYDWLAARLDPGRIVFFGRSLGGAVAARVALQRRPAGLVLESTFTSVPAMARAAFPIPGIGHLTRTRLDALAAVRTLQVPLLIIHGTDDEIVPYRMGRRLFEAAAAADKHFRAVPGGHHNDTYLAAGEPYWDWLREFATRVTGAATGSGEADGP